jgi:hypothetical protein
MDETCTYMYWMYDQTLIRLYGKLHWVNTCTRYCLYILNTAAFFKLTQISVFTHPFTWWHARQWSMLFKFSMGGGQYILV